MKKIAVYGAGGFGREVQMLIEQINLRDKTWEFLGYFDDGAHKENIINGHKLIGGMEDLNAYSDEIFMVIAIGNPKIKKSVVNAITSEKIKFPILIHPNAQIGNMQFNAIGQGTIITAGCIITSNIKIGEHVILNLCCTVGHDTVIENYCSFMPAVNISGEVIIRENVYIGTGAKIINQVEIGENTIIGAGAVVAKSIPANCTAVGVPAKPIKTQA